MLISLDKKILPVAFLILAIIFIGCSKKEPEQVKIYFGDSTAITPNVAADPYMGWKSYTNENVVMFYPPDYEDKDSMQQLSSFYLATIRKGSKFLQIPPPTNKITVFLHGTVEDGRRRTGQMFTFSEYDNIHYWPPYNYGLAVVDYLIPKWSEKETKFPFLKQGIRRLIDASGRNFHTMTLDFIDSGMTKSLIELSQDKKVLADIEFHRSSFSASFVDFAVYKYGIQRLKLLYQTDDKFEKAVQDIYGIKVDSLETEWLSVIKKAMNRNYINSNNKYGNK